MLPESRIGVRENRDLAHNPSVPPKPKETILTLASTTHPFSHRANNMIRIQIHEDPAPNARLNQAQIKDLGLQLREPQTMLPRSGALRSPLLPERAK